MDDKLPIGKQSAVWVLEARALFASNTVSAIESQRELAFDSLERSSKK